MLAVLATQAGINRAGSASIDSAGRVARDNAAGAWSLDPPIASSIAVQFSHGVRVVTYNIHSGLGPAFSLWQSRAAVERNLREIAGDILGSAPRGHAVDVVALNEVDFGSRRSGWIDEAAFVADELKQRSGEVYDIVRGQTWERNFPGREVRFGNALLVRLPILAASECLLSARTCDGAPSNDDLPSLRPTGLGRLVSEERGAIKVTVLAGGQPVDVVVTHLDAFSEDLRERQATHLLRRFIDPARSTIVLGDLNAVDASLAGRRPYFRAERTVDILTSGSLADARTTYAAVHAPLSQDWATYPAEAPALPLDAVLASPDLVPEEMAVIGRGASDHRGLAALLVRNAGVTAPLPPRAPAEAARDSLPRETPIALHPGAG